MLNNFILQVNSRDVLRVSYCHSQQNTHQQVHHHVPGTQDDGSSPHVTAAAAARAVQSVSRRFETHVALGALKKHREKETR